ERLTRFQVARNARLPSLAAFTNPAIFDEATVRGLVSARTAIRRARGLSTAERDFFMVGLAATVEDLSFAMKDGRALRILRNRERRITSLIPSSGWSVTGDRVRDALANQWMAMIEDVESAQAAPSRRQRLAPAIQLRGDARNLRSLLVNHRHRAIPDAS